MVAKITMPSSVKNVLNYNEQKVKQGTAICILASSFLKDVQNLSFYEKLFRFENQNALNQRASATTLHASLNFSEGENLSKELLIQISKTYMQGIGFGSQPYLVYQHFDAGHPHIHIVSINITADGNRISLHNLGRNQSSRTRKEIEDRFGLKKAERCASEKIVAAPPESRKAVYGASATKRSITNVLDAVLQTYKYCSLPELNAVLGLYNIRGERGRKESMLFRTGGLIYRILDANGNAIGVPIKASSIYSRPTLKNLEQLFVKHAAEKNTFKKSICSRLNWVLKKPVQNIKTYKKALEKEKIMLVVRQNEQGIIYGLTYIDLESKCVFNGSDLGKQYSANAISQNQRQIKQGEHNTKEDPKAKKGTDHHLTSGLTNPLQANRFMETLISPEQQQPQVPLEWKKPKRKRKRKSS